MFHFFPVIKTRQKSFNEPLNEIIGENISMTPAPFDCRQGSSLTRLTFDAFDVLMR